MRLCEKHFQFFENSWEFLEVNDVGLADKNR